MGGLAVGIARGIVNRLSDLGWDTNRFDISPKERAALDHIADDEALVLHDVLLEHGANPYLWLEQNFQEWETGEAFGVGAVTGRTPFASAEDHGPMTIQWDHLVTATVMGRGKNQIMGLKELWQGPLHEAPGPIMIPEFFSLFSSGEPRGYKRVFLLGPMLPLEREWRWESTVEEWLKERFPR